MIKHVFIGFASSFNVELVYVILKGVTQFSKLVTEVDYFDEEIDYEIQRSERKSFKL